MLTSSRACLPCALFLPLLWACDDTVLTPIRAPDGGASGLDGGSRPACAADEASPDDEPCVAPVSCVDGVYEGVMVGTETPGAVGVRGIITLVSDRDHRVALRFDLRFEPGDAPLLSVSGCGHLRDIGTDGTLFPENGKAELSGHADCAKGEITLQLRGYYLSPTATSFGDFEHFYFKGTATGSFDVATQSWSGAGALREPPVWLGDQPGGYGSWNARLTDAALPEQEECLDGPFPESMFTDELERDR